MSKTALVTGASSGIGKALCLQLAAHGYDIIGVSSDEAKLNAAAEEIRSKHGISVETIAEDLSRDGAPQAVYDRVKASGKTIDVLVNDAGIGQGGLFAGTSLEKDIRAIRLNVEALVVLTKLFMRDMVDRNEGRIMDLGSIAGFQPGPLMAVYHATKAFVVSFSEALATELKDMDTKVTVTCLCPGPTETHFFEGANIENSRAAQMTMDPNEVARTGYEALEKGERVHIPGAQNKVMTFMRRVIPHSVQSRIGKKLYESRTE